MTSRPALLTGKEAKFSESLRGAGTGMTSNYKAKRRIQKRTAAQPKAWDSSFASMPCSIFDRTMCKAALQQSVYKLSRDTRHSFTSEPAAGICGGACVFCCIPVVSSGRLTFNCLTLQFHRLSLPHFLWKYWPFTLICVLIHFLVACDRLGKAGKYFRTHFEPRGRFVEVNSSVPSMGQTDADINGVQHHFPSSAFRSSTSRLLP